jgi:cytochrome c peroxidase
METMPGKLRNWITLVIGVGLIVSGGCTKKSEPAGSATKGPSRAAAQKGLGQEALPGKEPGPQRPAGHDPADLAGKFPPLAALPEVPAPADNPITPAKIELGRLLFFENRLSGDIEFSCASCHDPARGWGDEKEISTGYPGTRHWRNSQTVVNSAYLQKLFWGGESTSLEAQAQSAITGNLAGNGEPALIEERLAQIPEYVRRFQEAFGVDRPRFPLVLKAIATFERAEVISRDSAFDRYMRGDKSAMSESALRGKALFEGKAGCIQCHNGPLLSDENFHNLGVPRNPFFERDSFAQIALRYQHYIRGVPEEIYREADHDMGLYYTTKRSEDQGKFRTPPLRYLSYSFPYMHDGVFLVLEEVIDFYDQGGGDDPNKSPLLRPLGLTDVEKQDLVEFLNSLAGSELIIDRPELPPYVATGI